MWFQMSDAFREETERYRLAFTCEDCLHFCAERKLCDIAYPTEPHRREHIAALEDGARVFFCKMFEST